MYLLFQVLAILEKGELDFALLDRISGSISLVAVKMLPRYEKSPTLFKNNALLLCGYEYARCLQPTCQIILP
ncbi:hypothetical protein GJ496_001216 [Pomphorhynchus laevis]|nr:hypothetical protein GJ496_001216 [Pomphorhynchus laevis]